MFSDALPYIAGVGCSFCYGTGIIFEVLAARKQQSIDSLSLLHLTRLFKQGYYLAGVGLDFVGWLLFLLSARTLPLFMSLSFVVFSLAVTAVEAEIFLKTKTSTKTKLSIPVIVISLALLGIAAKESRAHATIHGLNIIIELLPIPIAVVGAFALKSKKQFFSSNTLALLSGLAFGATGLIARVIHFSNISFGNIFQWLVLALIVYAILGATFLAAALQRASVNLVNCIMFTTELIVPSIVGLLFLGDKAKPGQWPLMVFCLGLIVIATVVVTLDSKTEEHS